MKTNSTALRVLVKGIVERACELKDKHTKETDARVNYAAVFAQSQREYSDLLAAAKQQGRIVQETPTGPVFEIKPLNTVAGKLRLLKVRAPDKTRLERGDADFTIEKYEAFKKTHLGKPGFRLIVRPEFEMVELVDSKAGVRAYFSNPPLGEVLGRA